MALDFNISEIYNQVLGNLYRNVDPLSSLSSNDAPGRVDFTGQAAHILNTVDVSPIVSVLRTIGIIATIVFGVLFVWILLKMNRYFAERAVRLKVEWNPPKPAESSYDAKWKEVREHLSSIRDAEWKFAVIEADKMIEDVMEQSGFPGKGLGEKLMAIDKSKLQSLDDLWAAHKLRNLIAHDPNVLVQYRDALRAIEGFEKALRELGVLS
ncbi:MAG: hypothetical protein Q7S32_02750 [bacterium]|nr:hypothetical protein [bacterium]